jgi:hypothetical protein
MIPQMLGKHLFRIERGFKTISSGLGFLEDRSAQGAYQPFYFTGAFLTSMVAEIATPLKLRLAGTSCYEEVRPVSSKITDLVEILVEPAPASRGTALLRPEENGKFPAKRGEGRNRPTFACDCVIILPIFRGKSTEFVIIVLNQI